MQKKWFRNKNYGYGWYPNTREGWLVTAGYMVLVIILAFSVDTNASLTDFLMYFFAPTLILTLVFLGIAYKTGETLKWHWGSAKKVKKSKVS